MRNTPVAFCRTLNYVGSGSRGYTGAGSYRTDAGARLDCKSSAHTLTLHHPESAT